MKGTNEPVNRIETVPYPSGCAITVSGLNTNSFVELPILTTHTLIPPANGAVVPVAVDVALPLRPCRVNDVVAPTALFRYRFRDCG